MKQEDIIRTREAFEQPIVKLFDNTLNMIIEPALEYLPDIEPEAIKRDPLEEAYVKTYQSVGVWFAKETKAEIAKSTSAEEDLWLSRLEEFAKTEAGERITEVWGYTKEKYVDIVRKALAETVEEGYDPNVAKKRIVEKVREAYSEFTSWRAMRIARTEIVSASNAGSLEGAMVVKDQMQKVWETFIDGETRQSHLEANGQVREMDEPFVVGGEDLNFPGDPSGSAENVINCRCTVTYKRKSE